MTTKILEDKLDLLQKARMNWKPEIPFELTNLSQVAPIARPLSPCDEKIAAQFPKTALLPILTFQMAISKVLTPKRGGILFSGGQSSGGHNVIAGLLDGLLQIHHDSTLFGFLGGPQGLIDGKWIEITKEKIAPYRNQGGFDFLGSGREKIETAEQFEKIKGVVEKEKLDSLVIVGGDDSNTSAILLAEYFANKEVPCAVIGVPKTIDGDLRNEFLEISFGYDTACKTYAELISNISRDILSAKKYYAFIRLMGRDASHVTLQCALMNHPNMALISEAIVEEKKDLQSVTQEICDLIEERAKKGKNYGVILLPEGLIKALPVRETGSQYDPHGNLKISQIETEKLLIDLVTKELLKRDPHSKFSPLSFFLGYEGRCALPTNFDANYAYALGMTAALATQVRANGYICTLQGIKRPPQEWTVLLYPLTRMLAFEMRKGVEKAVVKKRLVDLKGVHYASFINQCKEWRLEDDYRTIGPIQFFGPKEITDSVVEF